MQTPQTLSLDSVSYINHKPTATVTRQENADMADAHVTGNQVGVILHKKSTRAQTFYHVCKQDMHTYMRHEVLIIMFMYM